MFLPQTVKAQSVFLHEFFMYFKFQSLERITFMQSVLFVAVFTDFLTRLRFTRVLVGRPWAVGRSSCICRRCSGKRLERFSGSFSIHQLSFVVFSFPVFGE